MQLEAFVKKETKNMKMKIGPNYNHLENEGLFDGSAYIKMLLQGWIKEVLRTELLLVTSEDLVNILIKYKNMFGKKRPCGSKIHNTFFHFLLHKTTDELLMELVESNMDCASDIIRDYCQNGGFKNWKRPDGLSTQQKKEVDGFPYGVKVSKLNTNPAKYISCPGCMAKKSGTVVRHGRICPSCTKFLNKEDWRLHVAQGNLARFAKMVELGANYYFSACRITYDFQGEETVHDGTVTNECQNWLEKLKEFADVLLHHRHQLESIGVTVDPIWLSKAQRFHNVLVEVINVGKLYEKKKILNAFANEINTWYDSAEPAESTPPVLESNIPTSNVSTDRGGKHICKSCNKTCYYFYDPAQQYCGACWCFHCSDVKDSPCCKKCGKHR